jgi:predicted AAA+ superfamily ATPase
MISRIVEKSMLAYRKSVLLLGPRQVGKSTLAQALGPDLVINLANEIEYLAHASDAALLQQKVSAKGVSTILIDEVQRLPSILNTVQYLIDNNPNLKFYLTGSSARKLKRGQANLIPGRVMNMYLGPLVSKECHYEVDTKRALELGLLPGVYVNEHQEEAKQILLAYASNYLKEEIKAEALVRDLPAFSRFLQVSTGFVADFIDQTKLAKLAKISRHLVNNYYEVLEDTLIAQRLYAFPEEFHDEDLVKHPKFYYFDNGVYNGLLQNFTASDDRKGKLAEQLIFNQLKIAAQALNRQLNIYHYRTRRGKEVDFIAMLDGEIIAIEVKSSDRLIDEDFTGLHYFKDSMGKKNPRLVLWHMGTLNENRGDVEVRPWQQGLKEIGL